MLLAVYHEDGEGTEGIEYTKFRHGQFQTGSFCQSSLSQRQR